jgi:hypothetical protein
MRSLRSRVAMYAIVAWLPIPAMGSTISVNVFPSTGPVSGSPNLLTYRDRALQSLESGVGSAGNPFTDPAAYAIATQATPGDLINSNGGGGSTFHSWEGQANAAGAYSSEFGTQLFFGLRILGNGTKFNISNVSFDGVSTDALHLFFFHNSNLFGATGYNASRVGIIYGSDGTKTFITSGPATQIVDEFDYIGVGLSLNATLESGTTQGKLDTVAARIEGRIPFDLQGTYTLGDSTGSLLSSGTASVPVSLVAGAATPEPVTRIFFWIGLAMFGLWFLNLLRTRGPRRKDRG